MKFPSLLAAALMISVLSVQADDAESECDRSGYVGAGGALVLPAGGSAMRRVGGATVRGGYYLNDDLALEGEVGALEDLAFLGVSALWHWQGAAIYGDYFGYSRFDPFFTIGAAGLVGSSPGQVGPRAGVGSFYHLTDNWSLRGDATVLLGLDRACEADFTLAFGVQYSF